MRQQAQRHVLERGGGTVEQLEKQVVPGRAQGRDRRIGELARIGAADHRLGLRLGEVRQEGREDARGQSGVIQVHERAPVQLRNLGRGHDVQAAVGREAVDDRLRGAHGGGAAAGAEIEHMITSYQNNTDMIPCARRKVKCRRETEKVRFIINAARHFL